jgi:hypothetical protein
MYTDKLGEVQKQALDRVTDNLTSAQIVLLMDMLNLAFIEGELSVISARVNHAE